MADLYAESQMAVPVDAAPHSAAADGATAPASVGYGLTGLRTRLLVFVTYVLIGPFALVIFLIYQDYDRAREAGMRAIGTYADELADDDYGVGVNLHRLFVTLAQNDAIIHHDGARCSAIATSIVANDPRLGSLAVARPEGVLSCAANSTSVEATAKINVADRLWFRSAIANRRLGEGEYLTSRLSGRQLLQFSYAVVEHDQVTAVIAAGIDLLELSRTLAKNLRDANFVAYIVNRDGMVLARSSDPEGAIGRQIEDPTFLEALQGGRSDPFVARGFSTVDRAYLLRPLTAINTKNVYVAVGFDIDKPIQESVRQMWAILPPFAAIVLLAYAIAWWGSSIALLTPIRRLLRQIRRFSAGETSARAGPTYARNEIGGLGRSFDDLAAAVLGKEAALRSLAARYKGVIDSVAEAIVTTDTSGIVRSFNPAAERITGYAAAEIIGHNVSTLIPEPHRSRHDGYIAAYMRTGHGTFIGGPTRRFELRRKDGALIPIELNIAEAQSNGGRVFIGAMRDISAQLAAETEIKARVAELDGLFRASPAAIIALDADTNVVRWNPAAEQIFGYTAAEAMGRPHPVVLESDREHFLAHFRRTLSGQVERNVRGVRCAKNGRRVEVEFSSAPLLDAQGHVAGVIYVVSDVTERVQIERQLTQAQKMEAVGQLTGGIAHDFNNILGVLIGNLDLARGRVESDPAVLELVDAALDAGLRGADLNKRLLAFARRQTLNPERCDLNSLVGDTTKFLSRSLGEHITVVTHLADTPLPVFVDRAHLESTIVNLCVNARDAMPQGGTLTIETHTAHLDEAYAARHDSVQAGDYALLAVSDTGTGMSPEVLRRVFEPFFTTKPVDKGSGLGLSMVYGFVKQSGGHINIYSEPGKGTVLRLYLPRTEAIVRQPESAVPDEMRKGNRDILILVTEDNVGMRKISVRQLQELGYSVIEADNADAALALIDAGAKPDVLFADIVMPGTKDGIELALDVELRLPGTAILLTSGFTERATIATHQRIHGKKIPYVLLSKPFRRQELAQALDRVLHAKTRALAS